MAAVTEAMDCDISNQQQNMTEEGGGHIAQQNNPSYENVQQFRGSDQVMLMNVQEYVTVETEQGLVQLTHDQYRQLLEQQQREEMTAGVQSGANPVVGERRGSAGSRNGSAGKRYSQNHSPSASSIQADPYGQQTSTNPPVAQQKKANENPFCRLVNFEIEKKIGRGQFSVVYRAKCKLNDMIVALKKVQVVYSWDSEICRCAVIHLTFQSGLTMTGLFARINQIVFLCL